MHAESRSGHGSGRDSSLPAHVLAVDEALDVVQPGEWTTYGDLAEVAGTGARVVGTLMASGDFELAHRVLTSTGHPSKAFGDEQRRLLEAEGIEFDDLGRASPEHRHRY